MARKRVACGVYVIRRKRTNRCYVGSSKQIPIRFRSHRKYLDNGTHRNPILQAAWCKYGADAFLFEIVERCAPSDLIEREQYHINRLNSCYNCTKNAKGGAVFGHPVSDEARKNMSRAAMGNQKTKGLIWTMKARKNMSKAVKGKPRSAAQREATLRSLELARQKNRVNKPGMNWIVLRRQMEA